jgi:hypothetical protein
MNDIHYEIRVTEQSNGWRMTAAIFRGWGIDQQSIGHISAVTCDTRAEAFDAAEAALTTLRVIGIAGAQP